MSLRLVELLDAEEESIRMILLWTLYGIACYPEWRGVLASVIEQAGICATTRQ